MKFERIHHIAIICSNYTKSRHFYVDILGLSVIREVYRSERGSYRLELAIGERDVLELFSFQNPPKRLSYPEAAGLRHLALAVSNIESAVKELGSKGIEAESLRVDECTGRKYTFFKDPDDLPIELYEV